MSSKYIDLARRYVALSNAHDLAQIFKLFAPDARYSSRRLGSEYNGLEEIRTMMTSFFKVFF